MNRNSDQPEDADGVILGKKKPAKKVEMCQTCKDQPALCIKPCFFLLYHQQLGVARVLDESANDADTEQQ